MNLRDHLQSIYDTRGELTPELVVEVARPEDHPLHHRVFDKEVREAAEAYYRDRAQHLITTVKIVYKEADETGPERSIRAFHAIQVESGYKYEPLDQIVNDDFKQKLLMNSMEREWRQLFDRYQEFEEFVGMVRTDIRKKRRAA